MSGKAYQIDMANGSLLDKIIIFSIPLMLSGILQLLFNAADIVVVGRFAGSASLAAVGATSTLINLLVNLFIGLSVGANVVVAKHLGAHNNEKIETAVHTSIFIALVAGLYLTVFGVSACRTLLEWMATPYDVIDLSTIYLRIYFLGMPATMVYNFGAAILRAQGDTKRPLYYLSLAGVVNVLLNLFFVIVMHMDVAGVAIATIASQYISAFLVVLCLRNDEGILHLDLKKVRFNKDMFFEIAKIGLPAGLQSSVFAISNVVIQSTVNTFGSIVVAGNSAASNIEGFVYTSMNTFYQAALSFTGQSVGAKNYKRINKIMFACLGLVTITGLITGVGAYKFGEFLVGIYSTDPAVIMAGCVRLKYVSQVYFLCGIMDVMVGMLRGIGYSVMPMIVALLGVCGFRLAWIYTIFPLNPIVDSIYISYPISWILAFAVHTLCYIALKGRWQRRKMEADRLEAENLVNE